MFPGSPVFTVYTHKWLMGPLCHSNNIEYYAIMLGDKDTLFIFHQYTLCHSNMKVTPQNLPNPHFNRPWFS